MKKYLAIIILLFAINVQAVDEYVNDIADAVIRVKMNVGWVTSTDADIDSVIAGYYKEGALLVAVATSGRISFDTVVTTAYNHFLAYDTMMYAVTDVGFFSVDSLKELKQRDRQGWDSLDAVDNHLVGKTTWEERLSSYYDWDGGYLFLYPPPAHSGDSILIMGYSKPRCIEDSLLLIDIPVIHRPAIVYYATAMFATRIGLPTAETWLAKFNYWIQTINATINRKEYDEKP